MMKEIKFYKCNIITNLIAKFYHFQLSTFKILSYEILLLQLILIQVMFHLYIIII